MTSEDNSSGHEAISTWLDASYAELRRLARARLYGSPAGAELDTTGLLHESVLRLLERKTLCVPDRSAFFGYIARVMRSVVIDHVRARQALKRGSDMRMETLTGIACDESSDERVLALNRALEKLEDLAPNLHRLVELRYFTGLSLREIAELDGTSTRTLERTWTKARIFLRRLMQEDAAGARVSDETLA